MAYQMMMMIGTMEKNGEIENEEGQGVTNHVILY